MLDTVATVLENKRIAEGTYSLTLFTDEEVKVRCGQFAMVGVGQFPLRRPLAICKAEGNRITLCYRVVGSGTKALSLVKQRETLSVLLPLGNGFYVAPGEKKVAAVGGGAGVFPLVSAVRQYAEEKKIYSYVGFGTRASVCMEYELGRSEKLVIATDDGSVGYHGTSVQAFMEDVDKIKPDVVLACGPAPMLRALKNATAGRSFPVYASLEERMGCGVGACLACVCTKSDGSHARVCKDGPVFELKQLQL